MVPTTEACTDGVDNNCNGAVDEDEDKDGDGVTTCAGDCCDSTECSNPVLVNSGAFDAPGNMVDDDCDGMVDNTQLLCDQGLSSSPPSAMDYAKAIELCQTTTPTAKKWGVIEAKLTLADGNGTPATKASSIRPRFGTNVLPKGGVSMAVLSTGAAAGKGDMNPSYEPFQDTPSTSGNNKSSPFPADFLVANGNRLPNAPGCPQPSGNNARDPVMLTLTIRVPTNAKSFKLDTNFFSSEFPEYTCSAYNDFFVVLLDSTYAGSPANPTDKNLAFYTPPGGTLKYPVGVNLASGNTGLFTQCRNGTTGCVFGATAGSINTCTSQNDLIGTGFDTPDAGTCNNDSLEGGGTGWLQTSGNVNPGEIIKLRIAIWDTSDHVLDSLALVDAFTWSVDLSQPGTVIY
ncbi:MAG TPA: choice-of-anchor L domain-containing protein [Kofleriaceae bacterium]|nr:choice-of-anchor L domain-containing protein [Kofleriaceae bacterium]